MIKEKFHYIILVNKHLLVALFSVLLIFSANPLSAVPKDSVIKGTLLVGVAGNEPFVIRDNSAEKGIAIEIWEDLAAKKRWDYTYRNFENVEDALKSLERGDIDVLVGPISITAQRLEHVSFSQPFYNSSLAILSRIDHLNFWQKMLPFFSMKLLMAVLVFLVILAIVGTFIWLAERNHSPEQFPHKALPGIGSGMWLAIVTMSTTGYGDKAPVTLPGRIIAGIWMVVSIIFATSMVAGIASTLTLSSLNKTTIINIEQLSGRKAATIVYSPSEVFLKEHKVQVVNVNNVDEAVQVLRDKKVAAVVYDRPQLLYYLKNHKKESLNIAKAEYYKQGYGFAFPIHSPLVYEANRALLELKENQEIERIIEYYLQKDE